MKYFPVPDYHMHTPRCNHAVGDVKAYAQAAIQCGLTEIGMSDHSPMPHGFDAAWRMSLQELPDYLQEVEHVRDEMEADLTLRIGLEADFHPGTESDVQSMIDAYAWDYVIGSVHFIDDWGFDNPDEIQRWDEMNIEDVYVAYFDLVARSAETGMFDIIGHPDLIKKFGQRAPVGSSRVDHAESNMLDAVKEANMVLEISSAGLRKPVQEMYPHERMVEKAAKRQIPFAFGSDAHAPEEVGHGMEACLDVLSRYGVREIASFKQRQRIMKPIRALS
ncbi:MAG: histidinol-phosphatase HisJ [Mariprofundaceae bacterium]|nr:histidinol-phosphatase HisJ [Mariprofundaceae bacterium]